MENHKLFITLDHEGLGVLLKIVEHLVTYEAERCSSLKQKEDWICILMYPSYMDCFDVEELPDVFFEWSRKCDVLNEALLVTLQKILRNVDCTTKCHGDKEQEFLSANLHEIADMLPAPGCSLLEVYALGGEENFKMADFSLLSSLKRFEISYSAYFALLSESHCKSKQSHVVWTNFIDFNHISLEELLYHLKLQALWAGTVNIRLKPPNGDMPLQYYFLYDVEQTQPSSDTPPVFFHTNKEKRKIIYDTKIEVVSSLRRKDIPLHLINFHKYMLCTFSPMKSKGCNFFNSGDEDQLFLGILKYGEHNGPNKYTTSDWNSHIKDPFTHYLCPLNSEKTFRNHHAILIEYDKLKESVFLYFFYPPKEINVEGFLKLLKSEKAYLSCNLINSSAESRGGNTMTFYKNAANVIPPWEWSEKNSWHEQENCGKVVKSISRLKSDELFSKGVMIPGIEPLANDNINNREHELLDAILTMFDKCGQATDNNLQPVPVIEDRLLKNVKCEQNLVNMEYSDAKKIIGHGVDYCIDSLGSMRLSDRLIKVQKRFVPLDTINITTGNLTKKEEATVVALEKKIKNNKSVSIPSQKSKVKKKESRVDKHKRRLKTIVEGTVVKYGEVPQKHSCYKKCCQALFDTCVLLLKELTSSKDLNNQMKQFAKTHVGKVVTSVLEKHKNQ